MKESCGAEVLIQPLNGCNYAMLLLLLLQTLLILVKVMLCTIQFITMITMLEHRRWYWPRAVSPWSPLLQTMDNLAITGWHETCSNQKQYSSHQLPGSQLIESLLINDADQGRPLMTNVNEVEWFWCCLSSELVLEVNSTEYKYRLTKWWHFIR